MTLEDTNDRCIGLRAFPCLRFVAAFDDALHFLLVCVMMLQEVARLVRLLIRFYSPHAHHHVEAFNLRPAEFDLEKLLMETPRD